VGAAVGAVVGFDLDLFDYFALHRNTVNNSIEHLQNLARRRCTTGRIIVIGAVITGD
jgi:hypothetical protein